MKQVGAVFASIGLREKVSPEIFNVIFNGCHREVDYSKIPRDHYSMAEIASFMKHCESPIEQIMLIALLTMPCEVCPVVHVPHDGEPFPETLVVITPQFIISRYRVDFLITVQKRPYPLHFAIECDGIAFHGSLEKREQDRERDEYLAALGIKTIRLYGQRIRQLGHLCADEIAAVINEELADV